MEYMDSYESLREQPQPPDDPFSVVISMLNKKLINVIKNQQTSEQEIQLFFSETAREQLQKIITELTYTYNHPQSRRLESRLYSYTLKSYTDQLTFYIPYYNQILNNVKDVVIFTNQNACLFQVHIKDINKLYTIKDWDYKFNKLVDRMRARGEEIIPADFTVMDVYDKDKKYYYGICNGKKIFTHRNNAHILSQDSGKAHSSLNYIVINDNFMKQLLTTDLSTDNPNIPHKLLLFECGSAEFVKKFIFYDSRIRSIPQFEDQDVPDVPESLDGLDISDESDDSDDGPLLRRMPNGWPRDAIKETFDHTLFDLFLRKSKNYPEIFMRSRLNKNYIWNIFFNLLTSNNNFHRTCALQNFKYFFIKNDIELNMLYADINNYLKSTTRFTNMKLIDFFIPEIKFLLFHHLILQLQVNTLSIQEEWNTYVQQYNFRFTSAKSHLYYLVTVLLKNIVNDKLYEKMLSKLDSLVIKIIQPMIPNTSIRSILLLLKEQINKVIFDVFYKHAGGKGLYKKRSIKNKQKSIRKTSRKQ